jgi:hypothetical protein
MGACKKLAHNVADKKGAGQAGRLMVLFNQGKAYASTRFDALQRITCSCQTDGTSDLP